MFPYHGVSHFDFFVKYVATFFKKAFFSSAVSVKSGLDQLYTAPKYQTLFDVMLVMEKLGHFSPAVAQSLLENCNSIKVKRFFLYFAERFWQELVSQLNLEKINLGHGKRVIGRGGRYRYHPKYGLSLPEKIDE